MLQTIHLPLLPLLFLLLFLSLLRDVSPVCRIAPQGACQKPPFVPGHNLVGEGFDIVKLQTTGASIVDINRYQSGPYGNCTLCQNHLLGQEQKLPAAVLDWRVWVRCQRSLSATIYETSSAILEQNDKAFRYDAKAGLSLGGKGAFYLGGMHSKSSRFAISHATKDRYSFTSHQVSCRYYSFRLRNNPPLSRAFTNSLYTLPYAYAQSTVASFRHFIATYGTHYLRRVELGGRVRATTAVRTCEVTMSGLSVHDVSSCLSVEASATKDDANTKAQIRFCQSKRQKLNKGRSFAATFSDRVTDVRGGIGEVGDILFDPDQKGSYSAWFKSLKSLPGVVSFQLRPLHMLINRHADPQRYYNLRNAIRDYIIQSGVSKACRGKCSAGQRDRSCSCKCNGHMSVDSNCCPRKAGLARLSVVVDSAVGLWGDYFSRTDGYVKVFYGGQGSSTPVIWNNNFPRWNFRISFGTVDLLTKVWLRFEVWDRDNRWDDDLLGNFTLVPAQGMNVKRSFVLKHGTLYVSYSVFCAPSLAGPFCDRYKPSPGGQAPLHDDGQEPHPPNVTQQSSGGFWNLTFL